MTDSVQPIAGWYPDPENPAAERWWDGTAWSDHRRASTVAPVAPAAPVAPPAPATPAAPVAPAAPTAPQYGVVVPPPAAPGYGGPAYGAPGYGAPAYGTPGYGAPAYAPASPTNSFAVLGLILALGGLVITFGGLTSLAGGIISTIALVRASRMRRVGQTGHRFGMALAGTIAGYALFLIVLAGTITAFVFLSNYGSDLSSYSGASLS